jgi:hypothetical protein
MKTTANIFRNADIQRIKKTVERLLEGDDFQYIPALSPHDKAYSKPIAKRLHRNENRAIVHNLNIRHRLCPN